MRIGVVTYYLRDEMDSINAVRESTAAMLARNHTLYAYPESYPVATRAQRRELLKTWLTNCDVVVGWIDEELLHVRQEMDRVVPYGVLLLGSLSRGGRTLSMVYPMLRTCDALIGNCAADEALARGFFPDAMTRVVPFGFDESEFYPMDEAARQAARASLGLGQDDRILLYSGRITLEKNLQTVIKTFRVVLNAVPNATLVIAGVALNAAFGEFGAHPLGMMRSLERYVSHLGLEGRVRFIGRRSAAELRALYNTADLLVNLTLHHDENFGLAQVEAMACGLPVVGTTWGGLKDTIVDGVTGVHIPALVTSSGVKVDWWGAASRIVQLLRSDEELARMRERSVEVSRARFSLSCYAAQLDEVVRACARAAAEPTQPLRSSAFAEEFWATCVHNGDPRPPYRRGPEGLRLYREMIAPFAAPPRTPSAGALPTNGRHARAAWCLAWPLTIARGETLWVNDPIYPIDVAIPPPLRQGVTALAARFAEQPVLSAESLDDADAEIRDALSWMVETGLVLDTTTDVLDVSCARGGLGAPAFVIRDVDHHTDIVCLC